MLQLLGDFVPQAPTLPGLCHWIPLVSTPSENLINPALATPMSVCLPVCTQAYHRKSVMDLQVLVASTMMKFRENFRKMH